MVVYFHRDAERELREVWDWYSLRDTAVATRFLRAVDNAIERLRSNPASHPIEFDEFRWVRVRQFPFRLIFEQPDADRLLVLAVAHSSREPEYWQDRI